MHSHDLLNRPARHTQHSHAQSTRSANMLRHTPQSLPELSPAPVATPLLGKKTDVLHYYRQQNLHFLNLGSVLIGINDHLLYHFDAHGNVDGITQLAA